MYLFPLCVVGSGPKISKATRSIGPAGASDINGTRLIVLGDFLAAHSKHLEHRCLASSFIPSQKNL